MPDAEACCHGLTRGKRGIFARIPLSISRGPDGTDEGTWIGARRLAILRLFSALYSSGAKGIVVRCNVDAGAPCAPSRPGQHGLNCLRRLLWRHLLTRSDEKSFQGADRPDFAIDFGTANTRIVTAHAGVLLDAPSLCCFTGRADRGDLVAASSAVSPMLDRTSGDFRVVRPLNRGVLSDIPAARSWPMRCVPA